MSQTCCPLSGSNEGDAVSDCSYSRPVAGKECLCSECDVPICVGVKHELYEYKMYSSSPWEDARTCLLCVEIRDHFACEGYLIGQLWQDLEDNFFPDMKAGGQCMDGLSPDAKGALFEARLEWVLAHNEWEPEGFALPPQYQPQRPRVEHARGEDAE